MALEATGNVRRALKRESRQLRVLDKDVVGVKASPTPQQPPMGLPEGPARAAPSSVLA